jgi:hypothetical protein
MLSSCTKENNYTIEIFDLNGTWQPNSSFVEYSRISEEEKKSYIIHDLYSWGEAKYIRYTTFNIDLSAEEPFLIEPGLGYFPITEINKNGSKSIKVRAYRGDPDYTHIRWDPEVIFHFIDKDTLWIETEDFKGGNDYGKDVLWHRLSGPSQ